MAAGTPTPQRARATSRVLRNISKALTAAGIEHTEETARRALVGKDFRIKVRELVASNAEFAAMPYLQIGTGDYQFFYTADWAISRIKEARSKHEQATEHPKPV